MEEHPLSLYELNALVKRSIHACLPDTYWVQAELSDVRSNYSGHCYLEFVQKEPRGNNLIAKARGTIWSNVYRLLKPYFEEETGQAFVAGIKVMVKVAVEFHELYGYSLTVQDIDLTALDAIHACRDDWDVVVIIRGGGATSDLSGFDTYELAANCAQFPIPIITGIGHERDDTVLDCVSHTRVKTPTAAAEYLINHLHDTAKVLEDYASAVLHTISTRMERENTRLNRMVERIPMQTRMRLKEEHYRQERIMKHLEVGLQSRLTKETHCLKMMETRLGIVSQRRLVKEKHRLQLLEQELKAASPENLLKRGYSITLKNGKAVIDASVLQPGDELTTRFAKGEIKSIVTKK
ncbi:MAG: exodeoxyribonuclease VII large subunit [Phocaeicola vulgatus]|nr:exodeoxyribonuclease VII large subunit [Phocaeicola vulgatus]